MTRLNWQELSSSWDEWPFGHNRHGPKKGVCPFFGCPFLGRAELPSHTMSPGLRPTSIPSGILIIPAIWPQRTWAAPSSECPLSLVLNSESPTSFAARRRPCHPSTVSERMYASRVGLGSTKHVFVLVTLTFDLWPPKWEKTCPDTSRTCMQIFMPVIFRRWEICNRTNKKNKTKQTRSELSIPHTTIWWDNNLFMITEVFTVIVFVMGMLLWWLHIANQYTHTNTQQQRCKITWGGWSKIVDRIDTQTIFWLNKLRQRRIHRLRHITNVLPSAQLRNRTEHQFKTIKQTHIHRLYSIFSFTCISSCYLRSTRKTLKISGIVFLQAESSSWYHWCHHFFPTHEGSNVDGSTALQCQCQLEGKACIQYIHMYVRRGPAGLCRFHNLL